MLAAIPSDYTIIGTVLAIAVAILLLSGLALYVAFRIRETLKDEGKSGARTVKVAFLIGLLFLSGGVFYFFASGFNSGGSATSQTQSTSSSSLQSSTSSISSTSSTATTSSTSTSIITTSTTTTEQQVSMPAPSCPSRVTAGSTFSCSVTIYDQGNATFNSATLLSSGDFTKFTFQSCTESVNGGTSTNVSTTSNSVAVGNVTPGTTVLDLTVLAPSQSGQYNANSLTLNAPGFPQPISVTFSIQVTA